MTSPHATAQAAVIQAARMREALAQIATARARSSATGFPQGVYPDPASWMEDIARAALDAIPASDPAPATPGGEQDLRPGLERAVEIVERNTPDLMFLDLIFGEKWLAEIKAKREAGRTTTDAIRAEIARLSPATKGRDDV